MHNKFDISWAKIKGGCQSGRKVVTHNAKSDLPLVLDRKPFLKWKFSIGKILWNGEILLLSMNLDRLTRLGRLMCRLHRVLHLKDNEKNLTFSKEFKVSKVFKKTSPLF